MLKHRIKETKFVDMLTLTKLVDFFPSLNRNRINKSIFCF